jgi:3-isopropylmalate/(R)-2-methylmalate dehydratase small subunit
LQEKGIAAVVAEKFARIFYRSSIARALPVLEFENITEYFSTGDLIEIDIPNAIITNLSTEKQFQTEKIHPILLDIIKKGGLERKLLEELKNKD